MFKITRIYESTNSKREDIMMDRLAYIQYVIDNTTDSNDKASMQNMYSTLYNLTFNENGKIRSMSELYTYIAQTMRDNSGKIPYLPTNDQIFNIDEKVYALKKTHKETFNSYINRIQKYNIDKQEDVDDKNKDSEAKELLSKEHPKNDKQAKDKISGLSDIFGFTNILGLESDRKPSEDDVKAKDKLRKDQKDASVPVDDKVESEKPNEDAPKEADQKKGDLSDEELDQYLNELSDEEIEDLNDMDEDDFDDLDELDDKNESKDKENSNESFSLSVKKLSDICEAKKSEDVKENELSDEESRVVKETTRKLLKQTFAATLRNGLNPTHGIRSLVAKSNVTKTAALFDKQIQDAKSDKEKEQLENRKKAFIDSSIDADGTFITNKRRIEKRQKQLIENGLYSEDDFMSREDRESMKSEAKEFCKTDEGKAQKQKSKESVLDGVRRERYGENTRTTITKAIEKSKEEQTVKGKDGSEIIARPKKTDSGSTYIRKKNGKEVGYATKDEFMKAKKNAKEGLLPLSDYLLFS